VAYVLKEAERTDPLHDFPEGFGMTGQGAGSLDEGKGRWYIVTFKPGRFQNLAPSKDGEVIHLLRGDDVREIEQSKRKAFLHNMRLTSEVTSELLARAKQRAEENGIDWYSCTSTVTEKVKAKEARLVKEATEQLCMEGQELTTHQKEAIKARARLEARQAQVYAAWIGVKGVELEKKLELSQQNYVIADVWVPDDSAEALDPSRPPPTGRPCEVKIFSGIHSLQHGHGQSDLQRVYANTTWSDLFLATEKFDNCIAEIFNTFCTQTLHARIAPSAARYHQVILSKVVPDSETPVSKEEADNAILAIWTHTQAIGEAPKLTDEGKRLLDGESSSMEIEPQDLPVSSRKRARAP
jgi:hypothetical protein